MFEQAFANFDVALKLQPQFYEALFNKAIVLERLNRLEEAVSYYTKALKIKPEKYSLIFNKIGNLLYEIGNLEQEKNRFKEAEKSYFLAISFKRDFYQAWCALGNTFRKTMRLGIAIDCYKTALMIHPDDYISLYNLGLTEQILGDLDQSINHYEKVLEAEPYFHPALNYKGLALERLGRESEAITHYKRALEIEPNSPNTLFNMARYAARHRDKKKVFEMIIKVYHLDPEVKEWVEDSAEFDYIRGDIRSIFEDLDDEQAYESKVPEPPDSDGGTRTSPTLPILEELYKRACNAALEGDITEVIEYLEAALELDFALVRERIFCGSDFDTIQKDSQFKGFVRRRLEPINFTNRPINPVSPSRLELKQVAEKAEELELIEEYELD